MAVAHKIDSFDIVELLAPVEGVPAGSRGGVLEVRDHDVALVEITSNKRLSATERLVFVPLAKLRYLS